MEEKHSLKVLRSKINDGHPDGLPSFANLKTFYLLAIRSCLIGISICNPI